MPLFTADNAVEMGRRSAALRKQREAERLANPPPPVQPSADDAYVAQRLGRTRDHIARLDDKLAKASDPLDCERLARALAQLCELERILDGRPLPGSRRPGKERVERRGEIEPL